MIHNIHELEDTAFAKVLLTTDIGLIPYDRCLSSLRKEVMINHYTIFFRIWTSESWTLIEVDFDTLASPISILERAINLLAYSILQYLNSSATLLYLLDSKKFSYQAYQPPCWVIDSPLTLDLTSRNDDTQQPLPVFRKVFWFLPLSLDVSVLWKLPYLVSWPSKSARPTRQFSYLHASMPPISWQSKVPLSKLSYTCATILSKHPRWWPQVSRH